MRPEDALEAARREVREWRREQLATVKRQHRLDALTEWYALAGDAFGAPKFPADEALKLAREALLNVRPPVAPRGKKKPEATREGAASDCGALEKLRRLALAEKAPAPRRPEQFEFGLAETDEGGDTGEEESWGAWRRRRERWRRKPG